MGDHPLYDYGKDNAVTYRRKLQLATEVKPHESFSTLASSFFQSLVQFKPLKRYTAREALSHPWITRSNQDRIPLSQY